MALTHQEIRAELAAIHERVEAAFAEDANKYTADKHLTLEQVSDRLADLIGRIEGAAS